MPQPQDQPVARLGWLGEALGAAPDEVTAGNTGAGYLVTPSASRPQLLVPVAERRVARAALRGHSDSAPLKYRVAREIAALACRAGLGGAAFPVRMAEPAVGLLAGQLPWPGLLAHIFGRDDLAVAVSVGQLRPQIKPILHVATRTGRLLGHVKVGWNEVTRSLLRHEAQILRALAGRGAAAGGQAPGTGAGCWRAPRMLYHGEWHGREVLVTGDIGAAPWYRRRRTSLPAAATRQAGRVLGTDRQALAASQFWTGLAGRAARLAGQDAVAGGLKAGLAEAVDRIQAWYGTEELDFGLMHGDWAPWNMASRGGCLAVWDWERACVRGPAGFDGTYFRFQVDLWIRGMAPQRALECSLRSLPETMAASGAPPQAGPMLLRLVLLEVVLRQLEGVAAGAPVAPRVYQELSGLIRRISDETWRSYGTRSAPGAPAASTARPRGGAGKPEGTARTR
jgi:hypothetical protein